MLCKEILPKNFSKTKGENIMPLTTDELLMNMSESIELLINYIETAKTNGYTFPAELENDLADAKRNIETYNNKEYSDETII